LDELGKVAAGHFIFAVGGNSLGYADQLLNIVIMLFKKGKDGFVFLAVSQKFILHLFGGYIVVTPLLLVVDIIQGCFYIIQQHLSGFVRCLSAYLTGSKIQHIFELRKCLNINVSA